MGRKQNVSSHRMFVALIILSWNYDLVISQGLGFNTFDICSTSHITENQGSIISPGYPNINYPSNTNCRITVSGRRVKFTIVDMHIERSEECNRDWLKIFKRNGNTLYQNLCGLDYGPTSTTLEFPSDNVSLEFNSDSTSNYRGFRIDFLATEYDVFELCKSPTAENKLNSEKGLIISSNYPRNYGNLENRKCSTLVPFSDHVFEIRVRSFKLDNTFVPSRCGGFCDWIKIGQDGEYIPEQLARSGPFVPLQIFPRVNVLVAFRSDSFNNEGGFILEYQGGNKFYEMCVEQTVQLLHDPINVISLNYPVNYADDKKCEMIIMAPLNYFIQVNSARFQLQHARSCDGCCDWFMVEEIMSNNQSSSNNSTLLDKECGETSFHVLSSTNRIKLKFKSDRSFTTSGFSVIVNALPPPLLQTTTVLAVKNTSTATKNTASTKTDNPLIVTAICGAVGGFALLTIAAILIFIIRRRQCANTSEPRDFHHETELNNLISAPATATDWQHNAEAVLPNSSVQSVYQTTSHVGEYVNTENQYERLQTTRVLGTYNASGNQNCANQDTELQTAIKENQNTSVKDESENHHPQLFTARIGNEKPPEQRDYENLQYTRQDNQNTSSDKEKSDNRHPELYKTIDNQEKESQNHGYENQRCNFDNNAENCEYDYVDVSGDHHKSAKMIKKKEKS